MFWNFFSSTFGVVFGILMAILAFVFLIACLAVLPEYFEEKKKAKEKKKCPRCKDRKCEKIIRIGQKYSFKKLCGDCKRMIDKKAKDDDECEENSDITKSGYSIVQITKNGKTITIINGKRVN